MLNMYILTLLFLVSLGTSDFQMRKPEYYGKEAVIIGHSQCVNNNIDTLKVKQETQINEKNTVLITKRKIEKLNNDKAVNKRVKQRIEGSVFFERVSFINVYRFNYIMHLIKVLNNASFTPEDIIVYEDIFFDEFESKCLFANIKRKDIIGPSTSEKISTMLDSTTHDINEIKYTSSLEMMYLYFGLINLGIGTNINTIEKFFNECSCKENITCYKDYVIIDHKVTVSKWMETKNGFQCTKDFSQHFENINKYIRDTLLTNDFDYPGVLNKIFFLKASTEENEGIIYPFFWKLIAYMPEITFYAEWRSKVHRSYTSDILRNTQQHNKYEMELILILLNKYLLLCKAIDYNIQHPIDDTQKNLNEIQDAQKRLKIAIHNVRETIRSYLMNNHFGSIQYYIYDLGLTLVAQYGIHGIMNIQNTFTCFIMAFNIKSDAIVRFCKESFNERRLNGGKVLHYRSVFREKKERAIDATFTLKKITSYLRAQKSNNLMKEDAQNSQLKLIHLFYNHIVILKNEPHYKDHFCLYLAKNTSFAMFYYNELLSIILGIEYDN